MDENNTIKIVQYKQPPLWWEVLGYLGAVSMFAAGVVTANIYFYAGVTGMLLYWNYILFSTIRECVRYVNASEFSRLMAALTKAELYEQKEGTFQDSGSLTKEQGDEENPSG